MRTKSIPVILMLVAGAMACVMGFVYHYEATQFFTMLLTVLIVFYVFGCIVKIIIDRNLIVETPENITDAAEIEETKENIDSEAEEETEE